MMKKKERGRGSPPPKYASSLFNKKVYTCAILTQKVPGHGNIDLHCLLYTYFYSYSSTNNILYLDGFHITH